MWNKCQLIGRLGTDPDIKYLGSGTPVANFSFATDEKYTNKQGEKVIDTQWHRIVCFRNLAELVEKYLKKGSPAFIEGKIKYRSYENKEGVTVYITEIYADEIRFMGSKQSGGGNSKAQANNDPRGSQPEPGPQGSGPNPGTNVPDGADDLPF